MSDIRIQDNKVLRSGLYKRNGLYKTMDHNQDIISKQPFAKSMQFRSNDYMVIRRADKSNTFVTLNLRKTILQQNQHQF